MVDVAIRSNKVITEEGMKKAIVLLQNGKIAGITSELPGQNFHLIDVEDSIVMAGIVDPHVHINEPGRTDWEGFYTATKAAAAGGITTLVDMPLNSSPVTTTRAAFMKKMAAAKNAGLHVHCGYWGGIIPGNKREIEPLIEAGVLGFKAFLTDSGIDDFPRVDINELKKAMPIIARHNLPLLLHCELVTTYTSPVTTNDTALYKSYQHYLSSRPKKWEDDAIQLAISLCEEFGCRTHIVHLSSADSLQQILSAKKRGLPLTVETAQHYLYFNSDQISDGQTQFKCAPPIREQENNEQLWDALKTGIIDFVATDHSPSPPAMKEITTGNFMKAWGGIASLQFALPVLWTSARHRGCNTVDIARWLCEKPARLPGLQDRKGMIKAGFDADLVIWDPEKKFVITEEMILHKHKLTPYLDEQLYGVVEQTWLGGEQVYANGKFLNLNKGTIIKGN